MVAVCMGARSQSFAWLLAASGHPHIELNKRCCAHHTNVCRELSVETECPHTEGHLTRSCSLEAPGMGSEYGGIASPCLCCMKGVLNVVTGARP